MSRNVSEEFCKAVKLVLQSDGSNLTEFGDFANCLTDGRNLYIVRYYAQDEAPFHTVKNAHQNGYYHGYQAKLNPVIVLNCMMPHREQLLLDREFGKVQYIDKDFLLDEAAACGLAVYEGIKLFTDRRV